MHTKHLSDSALQSSCVNSRPRSPQTHYGFLNQMTETPELLSAVKEQIYMLVRHPELYALIKSISFCIILKHLC